MDNLLTKFEKYISYVLIILAMMFVCYQVWDLVYHFGQKMITSIRDSTFNVEEHGKPVAGIFFNILLTLEIIQTIRLFALDHSVKLKVILIVGLIAVTRRILMFEMNEVTPAMECAIASLILALSIGYFLVSRSEQKNKH